jgi:DNA (cytosine-5)-methyltransferase 1
LFAGIGGLDAGFAEGLEEQGFGVEHTALVEREPFPQRVLAARFSGVPIFDDVLDVSGADLGELEVLVGGFPCPDISQAKKDAEGLAGKRSGLWNEQIRIIREALPLFAVVENVGALLRRGLWKVLADLSEAGYVAQYDVLTAHAVGAPHQRERVFVLAQHLDVFAHLGGRLARFRPRDTGAWASAWPYPWAETRAPVVDAVMALGNAVVPAMAAVVGRGLGALLCGDSVACPHGHGQALGPTTRMPRAGCVGADGLLHALPSATKRATARGGFDELELTGTREDRLRELAARIAARRLPTPTRTDYKGGGVGGAWHRNLKQGLGGMPSPAFLEWVMGFPIGWTDVQDG